MWEFRKRSEVIGRKLCLCALLHTGSRLRTGTGHRYILGHSEKTDGERGQSSQGRANPAPNPGSDVMQQTVVVPDPRSRIQGILLVHNLFLLANSGPIVSVELSRDAAELQISKKSCFSFSQSALPRLAQNT